MPTDLFSRTNYLLRRRFFSIGGRTFDYKDDATKTQIAYCRMKLFKLKEEITIFADETMNEKLIGIKAQNVIDISAKYDVTDLATGRILGTWQRKGLKSLLVDTWNLFLPDGRTLELTEDSTGLAVIRRFLFNLIPQTYYLRDGQKEIAVFRQRFNPLIYRLDVQVLDGDEDLKKLIAAGALLLGAIEGRQS